MKRDVSLSGGDCRSWCHYQKVIRFNFQLPSAIHKQVENLNILNNNFFTRWRRGHVWMLEGCTENMLLKHYFCYKLLLPYYFGL
jgi:hypothetical protein